MKITCFLLVACLLLLPLYVSGEDQGLIVSSVSTDSLFGDVQSLYTLDSMGNLLQLLPEEKEVIANLDTENYSPFLIDGEVYVFDRQEESIAPLYVNGHMNAVSVPITRELAGGGEGWSLRSLKADKEALYFLYTDEARETPLLCRYRFMEKAFDKAEIEWLSEYFLTEFGDVMAVARGRENTIVYAVDFVGEALPLYYLKGQWAGFAPSGGEVFAADITNLRFVRLLNGDEQVSVRSPYAAGVSEGLAVSGQYYVLGEANLYRADFSAGQPDEPEQTLRVLNGYADETDRAFMIAHPNVKLEYVQFQESDGLDFGQALITGMLSYDVASISNVTPAADSLMDKGYMMDLSQSPELLEKAKKMYDPIQSFIFRDGKLMILPYSVEARGLIQYNQENLQAAGMSPADLPKTMEEYLDFVIDWQAEHGDPESHEDIVPVVGDVNIYQMGLLSEMMRAYSAHYRRSGLDLDFNTPEFRNLLKKVTKALDVMPVQTEMYGYRAILLSGQSHVTKTNSIVFPINENESPKYTGFIMGYIVDPRSSQKELAMEYIAWRVSHMDPVDKILLFEGEYTALERADFPATLERWKEQKKLMEEAIAREDSEAEKRELQKTLDRSTKNIEHPDDDQRYEITDAQIAFYQQEIMPNIEFPYTDITTELSKDNVDTWRMMRRFVDGELDDEQFISALNQRERLRRLESE